MAIYENPGFAVSKPGVSQSQVNCPCSRGAPKKWPQYRALARVNYFEWHLGASKIALTKRLPKHDLRLHGLVGTNQRKPFCTLALLEWKKEIITEGLFHWRNLYVRQSLRDLDNGRILSELQTHSNLHSPV